MKTVLLRTVPILLVGSLVLAGCTKSDDPPAAAVNPCTPATGVKPAKALAKCAVKSVAYVANPTGSGTGVVIAEGSKRYILTNLHVVDPYDSADVTLNGTTIKSVPVVGIDSLADLALLGPVKSSVGTPLSISDGTKISQGDDVFLVGYPGEAGGGKGGTPDDLEATVSSGIVSRTRTVKEFSQTFIQTDASIAGGQSGGPLFDAKGDLIGISGLSFADSQFALALIGKKVATVATAIAGGKSDDYARLPISDTSKVKGGEKSGKVEFLDASDSQMLYLPPSSDERTVTFTVDLAANPVVSASDWIDGDPLAVSNNVLDVSNELAGKIAASRGGDPQKLDDVSALGIDTKLQARETEPGTFTFPIAENEGAVINIDVPLTEDGVEVAWTSTLPLWPASGTRKEQTVDLDQVVDHEFSSTDVDVDLLIDLTEGHKYELWARSAQGDVGFTVFAPSVKIDPVNLADQTAEGIDDFDDTDDGIYGLDAKTTYEAKESGTYRIRFYDNDGFTVTGRFTAIDCGSEKCDAKQAKDTPKKSSEKSTTK